jgi:hypothetical protein
MKIALCMSGHIRSLFKNIDSIKINILPYNESIDIFLHTWDTHGWRTEGSDITKQGFKGFDYNSDKIEIEKIVEALNPKKFVVQNYIDVEDMILEKAEKLRKRKKYDIDRPENLVSMSYKVFECNKLKKSIESQENFKYDIVIRTRPDFNYQSAINFSLFDQDILHCLNKHCGDGISDIFAFSKSEIMDVYSEAFLHLEEICNQDTIPIGNGIYVIPNESTSTCNPHEFYLKYLQKYLPNQFDLVDLPIELLREQLDHQRYNS